MYEKCVSVLWGMVVFSSVAVYYYADNLGAPQIDGPGSPSVNPVEILPAHVDVSKGLLGIRPSRNPDGPRGELRSPASTNHGSRINHFFCFIA